MDIQKLRELKAAKAEEARKLQAKEEFTAEDQVAFAALVGEVKAIEARIQAAMELDGLTDPKDALTVAAQASDIQIVNQPPVYKNLGEQMLDVVAMTTGTDMRAKSAAAERHLKVVNAASGGTTGIDSEGGYLVETDKA
ncbi:MAG: hypothetical protein EOL86_12855, partial [Deltaproteobacteria bacterium]|nr:hypothetical protein [Deltaproteobacteria bacterium]